MRVYLVQHGEAVSEAENPERPLTPRGRGEVRRVGAALASLDLDLAEIRHSGKTRAAETADLLASALGRRGRVRAVPGMAPKDDPTSLAEELRHTRQALMLVGHLPFLAHLAGLLLVGDAEARPVHFAMGGVVCLQRDDGGETVEGASWSLAWMITPEITPPDQLPVAD